MAGGRKYNCKHNKNTKTKSKKFQIKLENKLKLN